MFLIYAYSHLNGRNYFIKQESDAVLISAEVFVLSLSFSLKESGWIFICALQTKQPLQNGCSHSKR